MLIDFLQQHVDSQPDKVCIKSGSTNISFEVLSAEVASRSKILRNIGVHQNDKIGILLDDSIESIISVFSCFQIGAIPVLLPSNHTENEIAKMVNVTNPSLILICWGLADKTENVDIPIFPIEELSQGYGGCGPSDLNHTKSLDDIALVLFTSGTTGTPKAVQLSERNIIESASNWHEQLQFNSNDVYLHCLPIHHIGGISIFFRAIIFGFTVITTSFEGLSINKTIQEESVTWVSVVPTMLEHILLNSIEFSNNTFRGFILSGSSSSKDLLNSILTHSIPVYKSFGMTETASGICGFWINKHPRKFDSIGKPFQNVNCKINDSKLWVNSKTNMIGYVNDEPIDSWFDTGDYAHIEDGFLTIDGYRQDRIISGGENIDPEEIRQCILTYPSVTSAKVFGKPDAKWGQKVVAEVTGKHIDLEKLKKFLNKQLSSFKIPKEIELV